MRLYPDDVDLWLVSYQRPETLRETITQWLASFPFTRVTVIANDPTLDYTPFIRDLATPVIVKHNIFRHGWETGSIAWCWNQAMRGTFLERTWCLMSQDDVDVKPGWADLITDDYISYVAPHGDTVQLQSREGWRRVGWFDERFRAIGGPEADYLLRMLQTYPDLLSAHDEHVWQLRHNDVGLANHWRIAPRDAHGQELRYHHNQHFANAECFVRWMEKWGEHVDDLFVNQHYGATRNPGWDELDWYPSFSEHLRSML